MNSHGTPLKSQVYGAVFVYHYKLSLNLRKSYLTVFSDYYYCMKYHVRASNKWTCITTSSAARCRLASIPLQMEAVMKLEKSRHLRSSANGSEGCSPSHPESKIEMSNNREHSRWSCYFTGVAHRQTVVLQQVSQGLDQGGKLGPLFGLSVPARQHDAVATDRGQQSHTKNAQRPTIHQSVFWAVDPLMKSSL